jgi:hypothetical protein
LVSGSFLGGETYQFRVQDGETYQFRVQGGETYQFRVQVKHFRKPTLSIIRDWRNIPVDGGRESL